MCHRVTTILCFVNDVLLRTKNWKLNIVLIITILKKEKEGVRDGIKAGSPETAPDTPIHPSCDSPDKLFNICCFYLALCLHGVISCSSGILLWLNMFHFLCMSLSAVEDNRKIKLPGFYLLPVLIEFRKEIAEFNLKDFHYILSS